jgi:hypothetical protein
MNTVLTRCDHAVTDPTNNTSNTQQSISVDPASRSTSCGYLNDGSNNHDEAAPETTALSAPSLAIEQDENSA